MVQKKVDARVRGLIEHGVKKGHRSMFVLVGDHGKDQVENLHKILSRTRVKARPSVLWCYKKELGFSTHKKKRMKEIKRNQSRGLHDSERDDPFDLFISTTNIRWTYYKDTDKVLGQTFGMCVLQDFESMTPNLLARTIETVEGGGLVIILLKSVKSLKQLYTMSMDVHSRFRTEAHHEIVPRFNERFILSLGDCHGCLVLDDELNILPISTTVKYLPSSEGFINGLEDGDADISGFKEDPKLVELKSSLVDTPNVGQLVALSKTIDQGNAILSFLDAISEKSLKSTVALTAGRGRGKSAAIGLCLAGAISYGYSNVFVTAPSPENLKTVFEFIISGLIALKYTEHLDFEVMTENMGENGKIVTRINIFRDHRQTIQYIDPSDHVKLAQAELVAIDEAAAIPLPIVKKLMGPYLVFLSSTINGYEGTGRSLSLKLIQQLRQQQGAAMALAAKTASDNVSGPKSNKAGERHVHEDRWKAAADIAASYSSTGAAGARILTEITLDTPIRYQSNDPIEKWLHNLLCLDITTHSTRMVNVMPAPKDCELYMVNRDALFSYHSLSESILQRIWALYSAAHYKNTPNDLQMLSDAPAHRIFVLLGPQALAKASTGALPDILCVIQVAFEGFISQKSIQSEISKGNKASGDLIPWNISQQFNDSDFATLSGARIVRVATHPDVQKMGYGSRAVDLLSSYFQGDISVDSIVKPGVFGGEGGVDDVRISTSSSVSSSNFKKGDSEDNKEDNSELLLEQTIPRKKLPPLLTALSDRPAERLHWLGVSYGLTNQLQNFWTRKGFKLCYLRQTANDLTGEHSSVVLKELNCTGMTDAPDAGWLNAYVHDYRKRMVSLMSFSFNRMEAALAVTLVDPDRILTTTSDNNNNNINSDMIATKNGLVTTAYDALPLTAQEILSIHLSHHDMKRLELYSRNMVDHHMILDTLPTLARLVFLGRIKGLKLSSLQVVILLSTGLQNRNVDDISKELDLPVSQVLAFFNKTIRKISSSLREIIEADVALSLPSTKTIKNMELRAENMNSLEDTLEEDQTKDANSFSKKHRELLLKNKDLNKHTVKVDSKDLEDALNRGIKSQKSIPNCISVSVSKLPELTEEDLMNDNNEEIKKRKNNDGNSSEKKKKKNKHKK